MKTKYLCLFCISVVYFLKLIQNFNVLGNHLAFFKVGYAFLIHVSSDCRGFRFVLCHFNSFSAVCMLGWSRTARW